jgi:HPt (histidine-containing phosphotransfer) domain-containing protein
MSEVIHLDNNSNSGAYFDPDDGIKRVGGNAALYKKLLARYVETGYYQPIAEALQSGDIETAAKHTHTLKGVSANLSLERVRADAIALETALKSGADHAGLLAQLGETYDKTIAAIGEYMA